MCAAHALLLTDVVDSTRLVETLGDARAAALWEVHDRAARRLLPKHGGREIDKTDGFLLLFASVADAVGYAVAYHRALVDLSREEGVALRARAGVHWGDVVLRHASPDDVALGAKPLEVEGIAKPTAARVMAVAGAGQTLLSEDAIAALGPPPPGLEVREYGHYQLKGRARPLRLGEIGAPGEAPFVAPADHEKVYRVVQDGDLWIPVREIPHSLPRERDAFFGRADEVERIGRQFDEGAPVVTLLGTGGTGKTRLSRRFAWSTLGDWPGGAWFADLSDARDLEGICAVVLRALGRAPGGGDPVRIVGDAIAHRGRCLVILDNFEQVVACARDTVGAWLDLAPEARMLVTSREILRIRGEHVVPLEPLPLPAADGQVDPDNPAIALFASRAAQVEPRFSLTEANLPAVARLVGLLDGIPLAIELAAARARVLSPARMLDRMSKRFELLAGPARTRIERQATLLAAIGWSWDLLEPWEKAALAHCSVFEGGFTLAYAERVIDLSAWPEAQWVVDVVQGLVDKSLLRTWVPEEPGAAPQVDFDEPFFGMYVSLREYSAARLEDPGAVAAPDGSPATGPRAREHAWRRHAACFGRLNDDWEARFADVHEGRVSRAQLAMEKDNIFAAIDRSIPWGDATVCADLVFSIAEYVARVGPYGPASDVVDRVMAMPGLDDRQLRRLGSLRQILLGHAGRVDEAEAAGHWLIAHAERIGDVRAAATAWNNLGGVYHRTERLDQAIAAYEKARSLNREAGLPDGVALADSNIAAMMAARGQFAEALEILERVAASGHRSGVDMANVWLNISAILLQLHRYDEAEAPAREALRIGVAHKQGRMEAQACQYLAALARRREGRAASIAWLQRMVDVARRIDDPHPEMFARNGISADLVQLGRFDEAITQLEHTVTLARRQRSTVLELEARLRISEIFERQGRVAEARAAQAEIAAALRGLADPARGAQMLNDLAVRHAIRGELVEASALFEDALERFSAPERPDKIAMVAGNLGNLYRLQGRRDLARQRYERAIATLDSWSPEHVECLPYTNLATLLVDEAPDRAESVARAAVAIADRIPSGSARAGTRETLAHVLARAGAGAAARALLEEADALGHDWRDAEDLVLLEVRWALVELAEGDVAAAQARHGRVVQAVSELTNPPGFTLAEALAQLEARLGGAGAPPA